MRLRSHALLLILAVASAASGCRRPAGSAGYPAAGERHFVAEWRDGGRIVDAPAHATYCAGDSLLVIVAVDDRWGAGLVLHGRFPVDSARTYAIRPWLGDDGTAAAAFRSMQDSVHRAVMGLRGAVRLEPGPLATGRFEIGAAPLPGRSVPVHLVGVFRSLPTTDTSATCSAWARTP
jgi:hypothetical protein